MGVLCGWPPQASFGKDLFSDKTLTQMARLVRDKEIGMLKKATSDMRAKIDAAEARASDVADQLQAAQERFEHVSVGIRHTGGKGRGPNACICWRAGAGAYRMYRRAMVQLCFGCVANVIRRQVGWRACQLASCGSADGMS